MAKTKQDKKNTNKANKKQKTKTKTLEWNTNLSKNVKEKIGDKHLDGWLPIGN